MDPNDGNAPDVFISYAGPDRDLACALAANLEAARVKVWWDACLLPHEPFEQQIQRVLAGVKVIVAILSPHALASEWVRWELSQASQNGLHVVPLLVNGVRAEQLPPPLHLLPRLQLLDESPSLQSVAIQIHERVNTLHRSPRQRGYDARRRLASATAAIARQAAGIKYRKRQDTQPRILLSHHDDDSGRGELATNYSMSDGLVSFLAAEDIAIAFTSFQVGKLYFLGRTLGGQLTVDHQPFRKPTGLYVSHGSLLIGTLAHLYRLENILHPGQVMDGAYSHCYVPRVGYFTGVLDTHDVCMTSRGDPVFVATRYNCVASTSSVHSFTPLWRPSFISEIVAEDRCHLNGIALRDGAPAYATALATTNLYDGWREHISHGGIVIDVNHSAIVCDGLSMPHSPRLHDGRLWVLNSGAGELGFVERPESGCGRYRPVTFCPGFTRGLAFHRHYAVVGLSRPRHGDFSGLDLHDRLHDRQENAWCGIQIIDTLAARCVHWFRLDGPMREVYDVAVLPGVASPRSVSSLNDDGMDLITIGSSGASPTT